MLIGCYGHEHLGRNATVKYDKKDSDYIIRDRSFRCGEREGLDEATIERSSNLSKLIVAGSTGLQIEPFYDSLRIHHAADQIDHRGEWKREHRPETR
jgi:hypothetical protein